MSKQQLRFLGTLLCAVAVAVIIGEGAIYLTNLRTRTNAQELLTPIGQWQLGKTAFTETLPVRRAYRASRYLGSPNGSIPEQSYTIIVANRHLNGLALKLPLLVRLGLKPSVIAVRMRFRDEKLVDLRFSVSSVSLAESGQLGQIEVETRFQESSEFHENKNFHIGIGNRPTPPPDNWKLTQGMTVVVTPQADIREQRAALAFDLSCISTFSGCRAPCQVLPSVWSEALRRNQSGEISIPKEDLNNPKCSGLGTP